MVSSTTEENMDQKTLDFTIVDVFARRLFEGNQLAVVRTDQKLTSDQMMEITREFGHSETTFIGKSDPIDRPVKVRIFGLTGEMSFAGHPSLGTAYVLTKGKDADALTLVLGKGSVKIRIEKSGHNRLFEMDQGNPEFLGDHCKKDVASALGVNPDVLDPQLPVEAVSTGNSFIIVPFRNLQDLSRIRINQDTAQEYLKLHNAMHFYLVTRETVYPDTKLHCRMIYEKGEDPATGSAAGPAAAYMLKHHLTESGEQVWIEQGIEIMRPSMLRVTGDVIRGSVENIKVAGACFEAGTGKLSIPD